jgi:FkbM family methyltransferase
MKTRDFWDNYFATEVFVYSRYFKPEPTDVVVDCGAHIGSFTCRWAPYVSEMHSFEPHPANYALLEENVASLGLDNVFLYNMALADYAGEAKMAEEFDPNLGGGSGAADIFCTGEGCIPVPVDTLDDMMTGEVDFIKLDVEGAEASILRGATRTLEQWHPKIAMEVHGKDQLDQVTDILRQHGYMVKADFYNFDIWLLYAMVGEHWPFVL